MVRVESIKDEFSVKGIWVVLFIFMVSIFFFGSYAGSYQSAVSKEKIVVLKESKEKVLVNGHVVKTEAVEPVQMTVADFIKKESKSFEVAMIALAAFVLWAWLVSFLLLSGPYLIAFVSVVVPILLGVMGGGMLFVPSVIFVCLAVRPHRKV